MAVAIKTLKQFQLDARCFICSGYFLDPVMLDCGHNFCHTCLFNCWRDFMEDSACPQCKETVESRHVVQNKQLASLVGLIKQLSDESSQAAGGVPHYHCQKHQVREPLKLFCKRELSLLCSECEESREHQDHTVVPAEEATKEFKHCLLMCIGPMMQEREKKMERKLTVEKYHKALLKETEQGKEDILASFKQFHEFMAHQEFLLLSKFKAMQEEIVKKKSECMFKFFDDIVSCSRVVLELEEKCRQPMGEFLLDIQGTMERFMKNTKSEDQGPLVLEQKWESLELHDLFYFLKSIMTQFKETLKAGFQPTKIDVTLDIETAHPQLILTQKMLKLADDAPLVPLPRNPKRFDECFFALGCQEILCGRRFWDVLVETENNDGEDWAVGVAKKSVKRRGPVCISPTGGIWAVGQRQHQFVAFVPPMFPGLTLSRELQRIRILLNYEARRVTFLDADTMILLFTISVSSASREAFVPFFHLSGNAQFTIAP